MAARKSVNGREKKIQVKKSPEREQEPLGTSFGVVLASDWSQKVFVFSAQSQSSMTRSRFAPYTIDSSRQIS